MRRIAGKYILVRIEQEDLKKKNHWYLAVIFLFLFSNEDGDGCHRIRLVKGIALEVSTTYNERE